MLFFVHFDTHGTRFRDFTICTASLHTLHMSKPNVTRVQSATQSTASLHTLHMSKPNVTRVQSATQSTSSLHTLHMPKPNVTRVQSATQSTASVHSLHMPKPNVTRVQSATQSTASVHTLHMPKTNEEEPCSSGSASSFAKFRCWKTGILQPEAEVQSCWSGLSKTCPCRPASSFTNVECTRPLKLVDSCCKLSQSQVQSNGLFSQRFF